MDVIVTVTRISEELVLNLSIYALYIRSNQLLVMEDSAFASDYEEHNVSFIHSHFLDISSEFHESRNKLFAVSVS